MTEINNEKKGIVQPMQVIKYLNYSEITLELKCISNFTGLFQHLAYAFYNNRAPNSAFIYVLQVFKCVCNISNCFTPKLGKHTVNTYIKKTLAKVLSTMSEKFSGENVFL